MFTGLITHRGSITEINQHNGSAELIFSASPDFIDNVKLGDSIAVNGVCLTIATLSQHTCSFHLSSETLRCTHFESGTSVNLEKSLTLSTPLGGHFVLGHVDGIAKIVNIIPHHESKEFQLQIPDNLLPFIAAKGSIALDGVSLTVNSIADHLISLMLIPYTLEHTSFGSKQPGNLCHVEVDVLARYTQRFLEHYSL